MKVIDLLNKIANGEIDEETRYKFSPFDYCTIKEFFDRYVVDEENLNLEIIEKQLTFNQIRNKSGLPKIEKIPMKTEDGE